jgi:hypothetical protein
MRLILSRKGFDSASGGCPSPILPDGRICSLPIPDKEASTLFRDLSWDGTDLGTIVSTLTRGRQRADFRCHLDPDLRPDLRATPSGWRPALGQLGASQGHLRNQSVGVGDMFIFWGIFRPVDATWKWAGDPVHLIWGWLQIGEVRCRSRHQVHSGALVLVAGPSTPGLCSRLIKCRLCGEPILHGAAWTCWCRYISTHRSYSQADCSASIPSIGMAIAARIFSRRSATTHLSCREDTLERRW